MPSGDKRYVDRLETLRSAGFESAERPNGSNVVAAGEGRDPEVLDSEWSRGRDLNPRPADYESAALPLSYPGISRVYGHPILHRFALTCAQGLGLAATTNLRRATPLL